MLEPDDIALLRKLPHVFAAIPFDKRRASVETRSILARVDDLLQRRYLTREIQPTGSGFFNLSVMITKAGADAVAARSRGA